MKIYIINGQGGAGKDTFQNMIIKEMKDKKITKISMVDYVKSFASDYLNWNGEKDLKSRKMLSDLKDLLDSWDDVSFKDVSSSIEVLKEENYDIVFIDARHPKDIERLVNEFNAETILIVRDNEQKDYGNHADNNVFNYKYDYIIDNTGSLDDLKEMAERFIEKI